MNLHEYQGKSILESHGVAIQRGVVVDKIEDTLAKAKELQAATGTEGIVIKAQIHAGGRGKGEVKETGSHGVVFCPSIDKLEEKVKDLLGGHLVTKQTSAEGKKVNKILLCEDVYYPGETETSEIYMSVLMDREKERNTIVYSSEGGMDIEAVAENTPHLIHSEVIDPRVGLQGFQARRIHLTLVLADKLLRK